jgi:photosystem I subunit XI
MANDVVKAFNNDPFTGHLSTPISDSAFTRAFIGNLPAYRSGMAPLVRGLEIGMAHGYFLIGPWIYLGPLRDSEVANLGALVACIGLVMIATACLSAYGLVSFQGKSSSHDPLQSAEGWSQFAAGFFIGGMGGAFAAFMLIENVGLFKGFFN